MFIDPLSRINHALDSMLSVTISVGFTAVLVYALAQAGGLTG